MRLDGIGDTLMLAPTIAALKDAGHRVGIVTRPYTGEVFRAHEVRSHVHRDSVRDTGRELRAACYDVAIVATEKIDGYRIAYGSGAKTRVGFSPGFGKPFKAALIAMLCTRRVHRSVNPAQRGHECVDLFRLAASVTATSGADFTVKAADGLSALPVEPTKALPALRSLLTAVPVASRSGILVQITEKWRGLSPLSTLATLCSRLLAFGKENGHEVRFIAAAAEHRICGELQTQARLDIVRFTAIPPWIDMIANAALLVSPDTGAAQAAGMLGTPVVDIFGSDEDTMRRWTPWASPSRTLRALSDGTFVSTVLAATADLLLEEGHLHVHKFTDERRS